LLNASKRTFQINRRKKKHQLSRLTSPADYKVVCYIDNPLPVSNGSRESHHRHNGKAAVSCDIQRALPSVDVLRLAAKDAQRQYFFVFYQQSK
jgi:hypothetical protein